MLQSTNMVRKAERGEGEKGERMKVASHEQNFFDSAELFEGSMNNSEGRQQRQPCQTSVDLIFHE